MIPIEPSLSPTLCFVAGILCTLASVALWHAARFYLDLRYGRARALQIEQSGPHDEIAGQAWKRVSACRNRLRFNPNPNPEWVAPLLEEVPRLVNEIATLYYPEHPEPVQAPRVSEFARGVQYIATDIAQLLQSQRIGRLIDVSAGSTVQAWKKGHRVWKDPKIQRARSFLQPLYKVGKPVWQVVRYNSPITWISIAASNAAIRTIHPAVVNIIARRAIDLYSGKLNDQSSQEATVADVLSELDEPPLPQEDKSKRGQVIHRLRNRFSRDSKND